MTPSLRQQGFLPAPGLVDPVLAHALYQTLLLRHWRGESLRDSQFPPAVAVAADPLADVLLLQMQAPVGRLAGCTLLPTYAFARLFFEGDLMRRHVERSACEISVAVHLGHSGGAGGLWFQPDRHVPLAAGDGVVFLGSETGHWREAFTGQVMAEVYLHYVRADGPQAGLAFDGLPERFPPNITAAARPAA